MSDEEGAEVSAETRDGVVNIEVAKGDCIAAAKLSGWVVDGAD